MDWEEMFRDLLDDIEQIPHPMAEGIWNEWHKVIEEEDEDE
jgi:hypothetical protein